MDRRIGRRGFLETAGRLGAGAILGSIPLLDGCKGSPTTPEPPPPPPPPPPVQVTLEFTVYNHTKGLKGSFVRENVMSGTTLSISVSELMAQYGIDDVDDKSIIIKKANIGLPGITVTKSFTGTAGLTVPRENTTYDIFLLNIDGKELYAANEGHIYDRPYYLFYGQYIDVFRLDLDGKTGEERVWGGEFIPEIGENGIIDQFNKALSPQGLPFSYGSINRKPMPNDGKGTSGYGFGNCNGLEEVGTMTPWPPNFPVIWMGINPDLVKTVQLQIGNGLGLLLEHMMRGSFIYTPLGLRAKQLIQANGVLNAQGKDFICYFYLRDWTGK